MIRVTVLLEVWRIVPGGRTIKQTIDVEDKHNTEMGVQLGFTELGRT